MIGNKRILAWIPARGGSKGIKDKNIKDLNGKPLIAYTIEAARKSKYIDEVMVSTDSEVIADISREYGAWVPSLRPKELAGDTSKTIDAVLHTKKMLVELDRKFEVLCLLQPTSPLRTANDIDGAILRYSNSGYRNVVAVSKVKDHPILIRSVKEDGSLEPLLNQKSTCRRQDMVDYYRVNGSIYINSMGKIDLNTSFNDNEIGYVIDEQHAIDIDEIEDFMYAEYIIKNIME